MSAADDKGPGRLAGAERFYDLKLKEAQLAQANAERALALEDEKRRGIELEIETLDLYRRELASKSAALDPARLDQVQRYASWVATRLDEQLGTLEQARRECDTKHEQTRGCFEDIAVLERVLERRKALLEVDRARAAQKLLDANAAMKLARDK
jgi:hypothetical protein